MMRESKKSHKVVLYLGLPEVGSFPSWTDFLSRVVSPCFPGYTVIKGIGSWEGQHEGCLILTIITKEFEERERNMVADIIVEYCAQFKQDSVLVEVSLVAARLVHGGEE